MLGKSLAARSDAEAAPRAGFVVATRGDRGSLLLARWAFHRRGWLNACRKSFVEGDLGCQDCRGPWGASSLTQARSLHPFKCQWPLVSSHKRTFRA